MLREALQSATFSTGDSELDTMLEVARKKFIDPDVARFPWHEVTKIAHYYLSVDAMTKPMQVREDDAPYGEKKS